MSTDPSERPILVAYDGSEHARVAISRAAELFPGRRAVVVTAWTGYEEAAPAAVLALPGDVAREAARNLDEMERGRAEQLCAEGAELATDANLPAEPRAVYGRGPFFRAVLDCADDVDAAAIVVGSRGRSPMAAAILGSVSTGVLNHAERPVVVIREAGRQA